MSLRPSIAWARACSGTHVVGRPDGHARPGEPLARRRLGDAEVGQHALPELVEHDVVGLDVAVDDAPLRRVAERAAGLGQEPADLRRGEPPPLRQDGGERPAPEELHHEVDDPPRAADPVDRDDVGVLQLGGGAGLALEALDELGVERQREGQHLDRHLALELAILGPIHQRHPAPAQLLDDLVLGRRAPRGRGRSPEGRRWRSRGPAWWPSGRDRRRDRTWICR